MLTVDVLAKLLLILPSQSIISFHIIPTARTNSKMLRSVMVPTKRSNKSASHHLLLNLLLLLENAPRVVPMLPNTNNPQNPSAVPHYEEKSNTLEKRQRFSYSHVSVELRGLDHPGEAEDVLGDDVGAGAARRARRLGVLRLPWLLRRWSRHR